MKEMNKELLSLVLGKKLLSEQNLAINNNILIYATKDMCIEEINLDTLCRKYKEWCKSRGYMLTIYLHMDCVAVRISDGMAMIVRDTELESVIEVAIQIAKEKGLLNK